MAGNFSRVERGVLTKVAPLNVKNFPVSHEWSVNSVGKSLTTSTKPAYRNLLTHLSGVSETGFRAVPVRRSELFDLFTPLNKNRLLVSKKILLGPQ
jgi:hypothetical protein